MPGIPSTKSPRGVARWLSPLLSVLWEDFRSLKSEVLNGTGSMSGLRAFKNMFSDFFQNISGWWLTYPSEKNARQLGWWWMMTFPIYGKNNPAMFQTTNQIWTDMVQYLNLKTAINFWAIHPDWSKENLWDLPTYLDLPDQNSDKTKQNKHTHSLHIIAWLLFSNISLNSWACMIHFRWNMSHLKLQVPKSLHSPVPSG